MTISLGERKVLKEFKIEVDKDGNVSGFMDLVSRDKIRLTGRILYFNDVELYEYAPPPIGERFSKSLTDKRTKKSFNILPLKIHFKQQKVLNEADLLITGDITAKEYTRRFKGDEQTLNERLSICARLNWLSIETASEPYGDFWRAGVDLNDVEILEAKNIPGLKDVVRK